MRWPAVILSFGLVVAACSSSTIPVPSPSPTSRLVTGPSALFGAMAFDEADGQMVFLDPALSGTWTWDGRGDWKHETAAGPTTVQIKMESQPFGIAWDPHSRSIIAVVGEMPGFGHPPPPETWSWHDHKWFELPATRTPRVIGGAIAQFPPGNELVMFGGCCAASGRYSSALTGTWVWDGATWTELQPKHSPPARWAQSMVYDAAIQKVVMSSGMSRVPEGGLMDDMWAWDGTDWTQLAAPPAAAAVQRMTNGPDGSIIGFGASAAWTWSPASGWKQMAGVAPDCFYCAIAYDPQHKLVVLVSNALGSPGSMDDVWTWNGVTWSERS